MRRADDHAETAPEPLRHVSDAGCGQRPDQHHVDAGGHEPRLQRRLEEITRQSRVLADEHPAAARCQHPRRGARQPEGKIYGHGGLPDAAAYSVGTKATHGQRAHSAPWRPCSTAATMRIASRVGPTSWVRMMRAPRETASAARPRPPYRRSSVPRSRMRPLKLFRDTPTKSGEPSATSRGSSLSRVMLCSNPLPKPTPGSSTMASCATPADTHISRARTRNSDTSPMTSW